MRILSDIGCCLEMSLLSVLKETPLEPYESVINGDGQQLELISSEWHFVLLIFIYLMCTICLWQIILVFH